MRKITLTNSKNHRIGFSRVKENATEQMCSYCGNKLKPKEMSLTINKYAGAGWNVRIHLNCINDFCDDVKTKIGLSIEPENITFEVCSRENQIAIDGKHIIRALSEKYPKLIDVELPKSFGLYCNYLGGGLCSGLNGSQYDGEIRIGQEYDDDIEEDVEAVENEAIKENILKDLSALQGLMRTCYNCLYGDYNYQLSDEAIVETLRINEYDFTADGRQVYLTRKYER